MEREHEVHREPPDILVVDDTPASLHLLTEMLTRRGDKVRPVPSGALALQAAQNQKPDLILLDVNMPAMNGYEVCKHLKADAALKDTAMSRILDIPEPPAGDATAPLRFAQAVKEGREIQDRRGNLLCKNGTAIPMRFNMVPLRDQDKVVGSVLTLRLCREQQKGIG